MKLVEQFWKMEKKEALQLLAFYRIGIALVCLIRLFFILPYIDSLYGNQGLVIWEMTHTMLDKSYFPHFLNLPLIGFSPSVIPQLIFTLYIGCLVGLLVGWKTRFMSFSCWLLHLFILNTGEPFTYGIDTFIHISFFYFLFMPIGAAYSIDSKSQLINHQTIKNAVLSVRILQFYLCLVYLSTGMEKAIGAHWWNGEAIWISLMKPQFNQYDMTWIADYTMLPTIMGCSVVIIEVLYCLLIWYRPLRFFWLLCIISMHLGIGLLLGLWFFSFTMIILNISAFGGKYVVQVFDFFNTRFNTKIVKKYGRASSNHTI